MGELIELAEVARARAPRGGGNRRGTRRGFGSTRKLPSGRWQARYTGPDGAEHRAPTTFQTKGDATAWLSREQAAVVESRWKPAAPETPEDAPTFAAYVGPWLATRRTPRGDALKPRTANEYRKLIGLPKPGESTDAPSGTLLAHWGSVAMDEVTPAAVRDWWAGLGVGTPSQRAHLYTCLRAILNSAVADGHLAANPCTLRGAGSVKRARHIEPATDDEMTALEGAMPPRLSLAVPLLAWLTLRYGELVALRRRDVVIRTKGGKATALVRVQRAVTWVDGQPIVGAPKSQDGVRDLAVPAHLVEPLRAHLAAHTEPGRDALLFPAAKGGPLNHGTFTRHWNTARKAAGRPDLRIHDLRHTGATRYARLGASTKELMHRLGDATPGMALYYQHAAAARDAELADALSAALNRPMETR